MAKKRVRHHVNPLADLTEHSFSGFENDNPVIIDVGADHGEFSEGLLEKFGEEKNFVVFEIRKPLAEKLREMFSDHENVVVFDGDANRNFESIVKTCLEKSEVEEIYVNFPDPWFKARHHKRRFVNEGFLQSIKDWMPSSTTWIFQTDQKKLFEDTLETLENVGIDDIELFDESPYGLQTKWEKAKLEEDLEINRMKFRF